MTDNSSQVSGILFLSFTQAWVQLDLYADDEIQTFIAAIQADQWYSLSLFNRLIQFVSKRYTEPAPILEQIGTKMMQLRYATDSDLQISSGLDFLRLQTGSEGYQRVIQGSGIEIGEFALACLEPGQGYAEVHSSTPFPRDLERGVLLGGLALTGDLRNIRVDNRLNADIFNINFAVTNSLSAELSAEILASDEMPTDLGQNNNQLQQLFWRYKELQRELQQQRLFWKTTNNTLSRTLTELRKQEQQLTQVNQTLSTAYAASQRLQAAIVDVALDAIITIDESGQVVEFNPSAETIFGYQRSAVIGQQLAELIIPKHLRDRHNKGMQRYLSSSSANILGRRIEIEALRADGQIFPVELTVTEVNLPNQRLFTAHVRDISDRKAAQAEIERQRSEIHQHEKLNALGSLLAGVAHELNNPLSVVMGRAIMLEKQAHEPATQIAVQKIREAAERCTGIVKTFLALARKQTPERSAVRLNTIINETLDLLEYSLRTADIEVKTKLQLNLPETLADGDQLKQVFTNLIVNAHHAMLEQPLPRHLTLASWYDADTNTLGASVADNGPGIAEEIRPRIFEPFYTTKEVNHGSGLGLSLCLGILSAHDGALELATTTAAAGAEFLLTLPVQAIASPITKSSKPSPGTIAKATHILVVDDETLVAELLGEMLELEGYKTTLSPSGNTALQLLQHTSVDAILCDMHMPDLNGSDFFHALREQNPELCQHIGFITGDALGDHVATFLNKVNRPYVEKPFKPEAVLELISQII